MNTDLPGCNYCNDELRLACSSGRTDVIFSMDGQNCAVCASRPRIRAMVQAVDVCLVPKLNDFGLAGTAKTLMMASPDVEKKLIEPLVGEIVPASLFGSYGQGHVVSDIQDLKEFADNSFDLFETCCVIDFVEKADKAFDNISRILRSKSILFFHINDGRLRDNNFPPKLKRYRTDWTAKYYPDGYKQPIIIFGRQWIEAKLNKLGFHVIPYRWKDPGTDKELTWWLAWRILP